MIKSFIQPAADNIFPFIKYRYTCEKIHFSNIFAKKDNTKDALKMAARDFETTRAAIFKIFVGRLSVLSF